MQSFEEKPEELALRVEERRTRLVNQAAHSYQRVAWLGQAVLWCSIVLLIAGVLGVGPLEPESSLLLAFVPPLIVLVRLTNRRVDAVVELLDQQKTGPAAGSGGPREEPG